MRWSSRRLVCRRRPGLRVNDISGIHWSQVTSYSPSFHHAVDPPPLQLLTSSSERLPRLFLRKPFGTLK
ncbi:hypothetical protein TNCV_5055491 [Trichonephila clavipes]|nr:hypothetical protein TNCV_5055431 [Trichonephila clavipes]GFX39008.1 hypothetical protein TNCV_5055491 [Trichonephila clavipes]